MSQQNSRRKYTKEFKLEAIQLAQSRGGTASEVARNLGIKPSMLSRWIREYNSDNQYVFPGLGNLKEPDEELRKLRKELADTKMERDRFASYGKLAPGSKADFAFVQHMIYQLDDNGTMACVLPHGVLFRGAAEGHIRQYLIEERNYLDAVIGLPANIFYGTSIPTCILVLKKQREHAGNILFIDASRHFEKAKNQNYLREEDIDKIVSTFRERKAKDKYSYVAALDEVCKNDYNLNIPCYVDTFEEEEQVDLQAVSSELKALEKDMQETDLVIADYCKQLGIDPPF